MRASTRTPSRFDRLPAWQRAAMLALTVLAICLVLLLIAESAVRIRHRIKYGSFWGIEETYTLDAATGLRVPIPGGHFGPIRINSFGFRGPEIVKDKPPGRLRIAFLGGSTTYCAEVSSNEMTWPALVSKTLHRHWPNLDLDYINAGVPGYTSKSSLRRLKAQVAQFKPDIIVIYHSTNDLSANAYELAHEQGIAQKHQEETIGWLGQHSLLAFLVQKNLEVMRLQRLATSSDNKIRFDIPRLDAEFRQDYSNLVVASEKIAPVVATATFSPRLRAAQSPEQRRQAVVTALYYMPYMRIDDLIAGYEHYNQVIREVAAAHHTLLVGNEDAIPGDSRHYTDSVHFTDAGSIAMADRVAAALISSPSVQALVATISARAAHRGQPQG